MTKIREEKHTDDTDSMDDHGFLFCKENKESLLIPVKTLYYSEVRPLDAKKIHLIRVIRVPFVLNFNASALQLPTFKNNWLIWHPINGHRPR